MYLVVAKGDSQLDQWLTHCPVQEVLAQTRTRTENQAFLAEMGNTPRKLIPMQQRIAKLRQVRNIITDPCLN